MFLIFVKFLPVRRSLLCRSAHIRRLRRKTDLRRPFRDRDVVSAVQVHVNSTFTWLHWIFKGFRKICNSTPKPALQQKRVYRQTASKIKKKMVPNGPTCVPQGSPSGPIHTTIITAIKGRPGRFNRELIEWGHRHIKVRNSLSAALWGINKRWKVTDRR